MSLRMTTTTTFAADVLTSDLPVLVDFTAAWCGPCRLVTPVLERLAEEQAGRLTVVSLDVDSDPEVSSAYAVMAMPTMALFVKGQVVAQIVGARSGRLILKELEPHLAPAL